MVQIVIELHPVTMVMNWDVCFYDCRGHCEDNWIAVPLLYGTVELV